MKYILFIVVFLVIGIGGAVTFYTPAPEGSQKDKKSLVIGVSQFPATFHPAIDSMLAKSYVLGAVRKPITIYNADWELVCVLCEKLPSLDDGTAWYEKDAQGNRIVVAEFTLKDDLYWGDGVAVTTNDVIFTFKAGKDPLSGFTNQALFADLIADVEAVDEKTFIVRYKKANCNFEGLNDFPILPAHLEQPIFQKDPVTYKTATLYDSDTTNPGLYNGPYVISDVKRGRSVTLARNPHWMGKTPYFDTIHIDAIENSAAMTSRLLSGEIDYIAGELGLAIDQALSFEKRVNRQHAGDYHVTYQPGLIYEHMDVLAEHDFLQHKDMRKAVMMGMNREAISTQLFDGKQPVASSFVNPMDVFYTDETVRYDYDPQAAQELLIKNGYSRRDDGYFYNDAGQRAGFTLTTTAGDKTRLIVAQAIQSDLKNIGIDMGIKTQTPRVFFGQTLRERSYDGTGMFAFLSAPESAPKTTLHSTMIPSIDNGYAGQNFGGYKNANMDSYIDRLETECGDETQKKLWHDMQALYADDLPALPLYFRAESYFIPSWLKGITPTGHQYATTHWIEDWYVE